MSGQLELFEKPKPVPRKARTYLDLNIHEKINVKGNAFVFARTFIQQARNRFPIMRDDHPEGLQWKKIRWHLDHNPESVETILWRKKNSNTLELKPTK